jgi:hypothetical protein
MTVMTQPHHSYSLTADVCLRTVTTIPLQPPLYYIIEYNNEHFASESGLVVITTTIRVIRLTERLEGRGILEGVGSVQLEGDMGAAGLCHVMMRRPITRQVFSSNSAY